MRSIKAVLFDIGGTLILTEEALTTAVTDALAFNGLPPPSKQRLTRNLGLTEEALFRRITPKNKFTACLNSFRSAFPEDYLPMLKLVPGAEDALEALKADGRGIGVVTGFTLPTAERILDHFDLKRQFDVLVTAEDAPPRPHPGSVFTALAQLANVCGEIQASETVYVGDTVNDVKCGRAAGVVTVAVLTGAQTRRMLEAENPHFILLSVKDLPSIIRKPED